MKKQTNLVENLFDVRERQMKCPWCDAVPHMLDTAFGRTKESSSGPGLTIRSHCEEGHTWSTTFTDHSGGTWISVEYTGHLDDINPA